MSNSIVPSRQGAGDREHSKKRRPNGGEGQRRRKKKFGIPSEQKCLHAMERLAGLVAMGLLKPAQANSIRAAYREILQYHRSRAKEADKNLANADVLELLRTDPKLLSLLEPLLTEEQVTMVTKDTEDSARE